MLTKAEIYQKLKDYDPGADEDLFFRAFNFSMKAHANQLRASGDPYFLHPLEVANILTDLKMDFHSVVTGLLHDTVEDTGVTLKDIQEKFGPEVANLVNGVTKLTKLELQSEHTKQAENFRKLVLAMSSDIRVLLVKLADRLHNMRTLHYIESDDKKFRISRETLEIYAPLAERMGINRLKDELEDLAFQNLYPDMYESIKSRLDYLHETSENHIEIIIDDLKQHLLHHQLDCRVSGREKSPYSIWRKMQLKNMAFEQLSDIMAFRVEVASVQECYQTLGIMHSKYLVVPGRFKDYISTPKPNGYQSIHTGVIGPLGHRIEVQIRTLQMNDIAEVGIAAHWSYKANDPEKARHDGRQYAWLRSLLDILETASGPEEFLENTRLEMFQDQVFCFTPAGELIALPKGATAVDFAYAIHSNVGDCTIGAKINAKQVPLRTVLQNGDQIEIQTDKNHKPSPMWERFVITGKAKSSIRKYIRSQQRDQFIELGKNLILKGFQREGVAFCEKKIKIAIESLGYKDIEELFVSIGQGRHTVRDVLIATYPDHFKKDEVIINEFDHKKLKRKIKNNNNISIKGLIPGMAIHFAGCCHPIPGDEIVGVIATGVGVKIHAADCETARYRVEPDRIMQLEWEDERTDDERFIARLKVMFIDKSGALAATTSAISKFGANIVNFKVSNRTAEFWELLIDIQVKDTDHLRTITASLRSLKVVTFAERI